MEWIFKSFDELTNEELYAVLKLRFEVFVIEQNCLDIDPDGKDKVSMHLMLEDDGKIIGCARILPPRFRMMSRQSAELRLISLTGEQDLAERLCKSALTLFITL